MITNDRAAKAVYAGSRALAASSLALALSVASLITFRGPISIISAMLVPSFLVLVLGRVGRAYQLASGVALVIIAAFFFQAQVIFVIAYIMLALAFRVFAGSFVASAGSRVILYPLLMAAVAMVLFCSLYLTEAVLGVPLHRMMLRISRNDPAIYAGVLLLEAALVCSVNLLLIRAISSRLHK